MTYGAPVHRHAHLRIVLRCVLLEHTNRLFDVTYRLRPIGRCIA